MCERRNASMVVTPWFGSCIPQPRLKLHALAWLARLYFVDCLSCSECYPPSCFELHPAAAFEAACSCVFRTFAVSFLFVMTMMTVMITTPALLKAYVCHRAFVLHLCDLYLFVIVKIWLRWQLGLRDDVKYLVASCA